MIKEYEVRKGSIGPIALGMSKDAVREEMKHESEVNSLERGTIPAHFPESDMFFDSLFIIEYDAKGLVETITLLRDVADITLVFQGKDIFAMLASDAIALFTDAYGDPQKKDFAIESCYSWQTQHITLQIIHDSGLIESVTVSTEGRGCVVSPLHIKIV